MICLDASVVGMLISPDEVSEVILTRYEKARLEGNAFIAPTLLQFEIASLLRKKELKKLLNPAEIIGALQFFRELKIQWGDFEGMMERSLSLTQAFGTSLTVYDASCLAVAEKHQIPLWTADKSFYKTISASFSTVELLVP